MTLNLKSIEAPIPTERMFGALDLIATTLDVEIPEDCFKDFFLCSMFLDMHLNNAKAVAYLNNTSSDGDYKSNKKHESWTRTLFGKRKEYSEDYDYADMHNNLFFVNCADDM